MNKAIYKMEMRRNFKSFAIWTSSISAVLFLGMLFYPAINADGLLMQMEALFENPMMKGVLAAFGADVSSLGSLTGFYVTYNSIYNVLLGCIFASVMAGKLLAGEESEKTAEFLYTKPVTRQALFTSKTAVLFTYVTLLSIVYFLTSLLAMEAVKKDSPRLTLLSERDKAIIIRQIESRPEAIYGAFNLTEESFAAYSLSYASDLLETNMKETERMNLDADDLRRLLEEAQEGPEAFFSNVLNNPERYMAVFSIPTEGKDQFLQQVQGELEEYRTMKDDFFRSPELFLMFFEADPSLALDQFRSAPRSMDRAIELLSLPEDMENRIFRKYSAAHMATLCVYVYLLILATGSLVLFISLLIKRGRSALGASLAMVFSFYFLNSISSLGASVSPIAGALGYISPFTWMDTDFTAPDFGLSWWRVLLFASLTAGSLLTALRVFRKKDILI